MVRPLDLASVERRGGPPVLATDVTNTYTFERVGGAWRIATVATDWGASG